MRKMESFEKVNPNHPDKVADRIAGAIVDLAYTKQDDPKIAVEVLLGHGECTLILESSVEITGIEAAAIVKRIANIDHVNFSIVPQDTNLAANQKEKIKCGDNGIFIGVPQTEIETLLCSVARRIYSEYPSDGKYILSEMGPHRRAIICQSNVEDEDHLRELIDIGFMNKFKVDINPLGFWTGGSDVDSGATNRKLGSDMGRSATGGGLHGKDLSKADVSVNIYCMLKAQELGVPVYACCAIGDDHVNIIHEKSNHDYYEPYSRIVEIARQYIKDIGGFEKFAEWGLLR